MRETRFHFIKDDVIEKLKKAVEEGLERDQSADDFFKTMKDLLPVHKTDQSTWKARVEGYFEVSDRLFDVVLDKGQALHGDDWSKGRIVHEAKLRPFSYYHWLTGSREPASNVLTRDDFLNDATTAMVKLEDDIKSLFLLYRKLIEA
ncbi:MAG: hypothetical protein P9L92_11205 [Candidatus Electryonea clarkiae]|nr:hypothetical protein [Candidatus Electryonea clarkiae]MDP8288078.1 hypothetical protein [Candidatus Electryonea clarkiae]